MLTRGLPENPTPQRIFDKVAKHLFVQGKPSMLPGGGCAYRGKDGCSCAIGVLIPDDRYDPDLEGKPVGSDKVMVAFDEDLWTTLPFNRNGAHLLSRLQTAHDGAAYHSVDRFRAVVRSELRCVAREFGLDAGVLKEFEPGLA